MRGTLLERFNSKTNKTSTCWIWTGAKNEFGYGKINLGKRGAGIGKAHRVSYELFIGPIGGYCVLHKCDVPACVNPAHLFLGTKADNSKDMQSKGRGKGQLVAGDPRSANGKLNTAKTHCPQGHPYSGENLYTTTENKRHCRICRRAAGRRSDATRRSRHKLNKAL